MNARLGAADGRLIVVIVLAAYLAAAAIGGASQWKRVHEPVETPSFLDMRSLTSAWECSRKGVDPLPANPCDPHGRPANYPRIWLALRVFGLGDSAAVPLGVANGAVFFLSVLLLVGRLRLLEGVVIAAALCSPAVMFGVERGNVDLTVVALVCAGLVLLRKQRAVAWVGSHALFLLAAVLKLFPVFALVVLARQSGRRLWLAALVAVLVVIDVIATLGDLKTIHRVLPQRIPLSYGVGVLSDGLAELHALRTSAMSPHSLSHAIAAALVVIGAALAWLLTRRAPIRLLDDGLTLRTDAFYAGAATYVGTYVVTHNYDYRLASLILVLPLLMTRGGSASATRHVARMGIALVIASLYVGGQLWSTAFPWDELVNWPLFVYLAAALLAGVSTRRGGAGLLPAFGR